MLIRSRHPNEPRESEVTPESLYLSRRELIAAAGVGVLSTATSSFAKDEPARAEPSPLGATKSALSTSEPKTSLEDVTSYNNFYEFGTDKEEPAIRAKAFKTKPWSVSIEGEVAKPGVIPLETLLAPHALEERIYRLRCVETWSMVVPWVGFPLRALLERLEPTSKAKYVEFRTRFDPTNMPGQQRDVLEWPYREGLRMDEAMHPLTLLAVGLYGRVLPNQNGAPLRLVVPWKYGFKSIKSIDSIRLRPDQPATAWNVAAPDEYGFYANVNPAVDHPRWSQKRERRIGDFGRRPTQLFNGYADQVASLYTGMDLAKQF